MRIGLDYGGVISRNPKAWADTIRRAIERGHEVFLISHVGDERSYTRHNKYAKATGMVDLSFIDPAINEYEIAGRKARICKDNAIELFVDDSPLRAQAVGCVSIHSRRSMWQIAQQLIDGLGNG